MDWPVYGLVYPIRRLFAKLPTRYCKINNCLVRHENGYKDPEGELNLYVFMCDKSFFQLIRMQFGHKQYKKYLMMIIENQKGS